MSLFNITPPPTTVQQYAAGFVYVNGQALMEEAHFAITQTNSSKPVSTIGNTYAGELLGSSFTEIVITSNVPASGFDFEPSSAIQVLAPITFVAAMGGSNLQFTGNVLQSQIEHGIDSSAKIVIHARGAFATWQ